MQFFRAIHLKKYVILGVSVLAAIGLGAHFLPPAAEYTSAVLTAQTKRELPIYCVQTDEKRWQSVLMLHGVRTIQMSCYRF